MVIRSIPLPQDLKGHLLYACVHGLTTALQLVLNSAQDINLNAPLPCTNEQGLSPLAIAAMSSSPPCCELLLKAGAILDWSDDLGERQPILCCVMDVLYTWDGLCSLL